MLFARKVGHGLFLVLRGSGLQKRKYNKTDTVGFLPILENVGDFHHHRNFLLRSNVPAVNLVDVSAS